MSKPYWRILPKSLALCTLLGLLTAALFTFFQAKVYEASTILQVRPNTSSFDILHEAYSQSGSYPAFYPTEFEVIKAQKTLDIVIDDLDLLNRWNTDRDTVRQRLSENIHVKNIRGTDLIEIRVHAASPEEAQAIAKKLSDAYTERRLKLESQRTDQALIELRDASQKQQAVVEDKRKTLTTIIRNQGIRYSHGQSTSAGSNYASLHKHIILLESQIETLLKFDGDQLMTYASGLQTPENMIQVLHPHYLDAKRSLDALKLGGLGDDHPTVKQQQEVVEDMRRDLDKGVVALRETLQAQLELSRDQASNLTSQMQQPPGSQKNIPSFDEAKAEFETAQRLLERLKIKLISNEMSHRIIESPIIIHEAPALPTKPIYPHLLRNLTLGLLSGLTLGFIGPFLLIPILNRRSPN